MIPTVRQQSYVKRWAKKWKRRLLLSEWTVHVDFAESPHPEDTDVAACLATADPSFRYLTVSILIYPEFWSRDEKEQERTIVHELMHAPASHTQALILRRVARKRVTDDEAADANERLVEWMTNCLWAAYE